MQEASRNTCSGFYKHKRGHGVGQLKHGLVLKSTEQFKSYPLCIDHGVTEGGRGAPSPASKREISVPQTFGLWHPPSSGPSPCLGLRGCRCQCPQMGPDQPCHLRGGHVLQSILLPPARQQCSNASCLLRACHFEVLPVYLHRH